MLRAVALFYLWTVGGGITIAVAALLARRLRDAVRRWHRPRRHLTASSRGPLSPPQHPALSRIEMRVIEPAEDQDEL